MSNIKKTELIDWGLLLSEFEIFDPGAEFIQIDTSVFVRSLVDPVPEFVDVFLQRRLERGVDRKAVVRDLYVFLLEKRYNQRVNLLHFAFEIFDDKTCLPREVIDRTPLQHEDGTPNFRHRLNPDYKLRIELL